MTVSYISRIATSNSFRVFKLLLTWKGSIYKTIRIELIVYIILYILISLLHHLILNKKYKLQFEAFCQFCSNGSNLIPVGLVLGFYVNLVVQRWTDQFVTLPWPDTLAIYINTFIIGSEEEPRLIRRSIMRYVTVSQILCYASISSKARRIFSSDQVLYDKGLLTEEELDLLNNFKTTSNKHFVPIGWAQELVVKAQKGKYLYDNKRVLLLTNELNEFRDKLRMLFAYDWINPPLIYTQIAIITMYSYFIFSIFGKQFNLAENTRMSQGLNLYVPVFGALEFINYMGWLKVAQCLINPFGDDEDDFEIDQIIFRNFEYSFITVDQWHQQCPQLRKDMYYEDKTPSLIDCCHRYITGSIGKKKKYISKCSSEGSKRY